MERYYFMCSARLKRVPVKDERRRTEDNDGNTKGSEDIELCSCRGKELVKESVKWIRQILKVSKTDREETGA
jgi:hypothetical protein